ncbi:gluconate 2-dehydrogenase subunit 3 family protein [Baekduia soli]|uniref:Gluconate 2-dehydrogenase subunit 3 family protein n=1 Tax=Baekduia soli TaxID=496014 RepID=A0A5B8U3G9_9ACTN|nr:gluconate 2-dehydrogenase subunit 3 family protein [Baekduia soli]QEC47418.1 gluconate 2-dehydrogenase subunit 3 family protein [Baekduia soli]
MAHSFAGADHLPHNRAGRPAADPAGLPRQRRGTTPQGHGRYPDFDVLAEAEHWDEVTRAVVLKRVHEVPPIRFFTDEEVRCLRPFLDLLLAQDHEPRIPVLEMVDKKMHEGKLDGYRHAGMPEDPVTWRLVAAGLDEAARRLGANDFATAPDGTQYDIVDAFSRGDLAGGVWERIAPSTAWSVVTRAALAEFYSHPWAWNEIGFGGPAYPRGYMRLAPGPRGREPFEAEEAFGLDPVTDVSRRGLR